MQIAAIIETSEKDLIPALETFFNKIYKKGQLTSHGLDHHRRVWKYAKELLQYIEKKDSFEHIYINKLLIACYLHDIGMSIDTGERHGRYSREICRKFLRENNLNESDYQDLLQAIESHDNKEYSDNITGYNLQMILSVADDLDAFGETGISRYLEIYRERSIEKNKIGIAVRDNARKRFENFERFFGRYPELVAKHQKRYLVLVNYFKYNY